MHRVYCRTLGVSLAMLALLAGCEGNGGYEDRVYELGERDAGGEEPEPDAGEGDDTGAEPPGPTCPPAVSSEPLRARTNVLSQSSGGSTQGVFTRDLFSLFRSHCGGCHVDQGLGGLQVSLQNFPATVSTGVLARIRSDDPLEYMPPSASGGKPFGERADGDPVVELARLIEAWLRAGSPDDVFYPEGIAARGGKTFALDSAKALAMTNLGNCVPAARIIGREEARSAELDAMFASATALPERLEQTDLFSLDAEELARSGMIAFAPAYTLWADNAKKLRQVRVPRGQAIEFDKATQSFRIPPNTRFYKTFFKRVIDYRGEESYRKLETRLIVSRPDVEQPDGSFTTGALFGTYVWNEDETEAVLLRDPLRDGTPFRDRLITYVTDERIADEVIATGPEDLQEALEERGVSRTYAVPGSARCIHCHMGAPNMSFVLGFTPLQLRRRPMPEGGIIEPAERDELTQLQRLIDYGVIGGMTAPEDVVLLEDSQGDRKPRNAHELAAQGYMVGNCAHCHNPRGFPSVTAPELRDALNFLPSNEGGGIFQFPLDRVSPRIVRGEKRDLAIPYVSPSIYDRPRPGEFEHPEAKVAWRSACTDASRANCMSYIDAPWRSLIYRNVDTPFSYAEDSAIFPHMPMDTPGYDCRARRLLGEWMVSIPVRWKYAGLGLQQWTYVSKEPRESDDPTPFEEILPGQPGYGNAQLFAKERLARFWASPRYHDCPDPALDVVDPRVLRGEAAVPGPITERAVLDENGERAGVYSLSVPERAHWADTDLTQAPGDWNPRRPDWAQVLGAGGPSTGGSERTVIELLRTIRVTQPLRELALTEQPFGLWKQKAGCDFSAQRKVGDFTGQQRPRWMDEHVSLEPSAPVYQLAPGAMVFTSICSNCHGPLADSQGRLAATIADMTGGQTRVANLRDGLFGPAAAPGENLSRVFGVLDGQSGSELDWAARYLLWMGLGGTQRSIPPAVLGVVSSTSVLGDSRQGNVYDLSVVRDANMLSVAQVLCAQVLPRNLLPFDVQEGLPDRKGSALIVRNGDAAVWEQLCTFDNPLPVRVVDVTNSAGSSFRTRDFTQDGLIRRQSYPSGALVGDPRLGVSTGLDADNPAPWCIKNPGGEYLQNLLSYWKSTFGKTSEPPLCPDGLVERGNRLSDEELVRWTTRGAITAGLTVFLYLDALARGQTRRLVPYDHCEDLR
jgi:mono/diheme cytochrome c family protein